MKKIFYFLVIQLAITIQGNAQCWAKVSGGGIHTLALKNDGTLWAWGNNFYGQLGNGTNTDHTTPVQVGTASDWTSVFASTGGHSLALKSNGTLWAWGNNSFGQLGNGTNINSNVPVQSGSDNDWLMISPGNEYVLALKTNLTLWAWGVNNFRQLGDGSTTNSNIPIQIGTDNDWTWLDAGFETSLAIKTNGSIWAWGSNFNGIFGNGTTGTFSDVPIQVSATNDWATLSASTHVMARKTDGTLWAWGSNSSGGLGDGTTTDKLSPVQIGTDTDWDDVIAGGSFTMALKTDGTRWYWGQNVFGQYGNNTFFPAFLVPTQLPFPTDWESISVSDATAFGIRTGSNLWGWGAGVFGNIGNGTTANSGIPAQISCNITLPVTWLSINGQLQNNNAIIKWATASEANTDKFEIEHSTNGIIYNKVGAKAAAGNSSSTLQYEFIHPSPVSGRNYYRIKQIDIDGRFTYSSVILLQNSDAKTKVIIAPNPVINTLSLFFNEAGSKIIQLINMDGRVLLTQTINGANSTHTINMEQMPAGMYILRLANDKGTDTYKINKQ